jgi:hypothetical protein
LSGVGGFHNDTLVGDSVGGRGPSQIGEKAVWVLAVSLSWPELFEMLYGAYCGSLLGLRYRERKCKRVWLVEMVYDSFFASSFVDFTTTASFAASSVKGIVGTFFVSDRSITKCSPLKCSRPKHLRTQDPVPEWAFPFLHTLLTAMAISNCRKAILEVMKTIPRLPEAHFSKREKRTHFNEGF